jgi:hypothetical protein
MNPVRMSKPGRTNSTVGDLDLEALPGAEGSARCDGQLLAAARPRCLPVAHLDVAHLEPDEVEVEAAQVWVARAVMDARPSSRSVAGS